MRRSSLALFLCTAFTLLCLSVKTRAAQHDPAFWKSIRTNDFTVPAGESVSALALDIPTLAGSADTSLRDDCAYEILATWLHRDLLSKDVCEALRKRLLPGMIASIGDANTDTVFNRAFSALYMSLLAEHDLRDPFLSDAGFEETLDAAIRCYAAEKDLRGYIEGKGWAHATAHVADLLKYLGSSAHLSVQEQKRIVQAVAQRCRSADQVFIWGEDARMADALVAISNRKDFDSAPFETWFDALKSENTVLWKSPQVDEHTYASVRSQINVLAHLAAKRTASDASCIQPAFRDKLAATIEKLD